MLIACVRCLCCDYCQSEDVELIENELALAKEQIEQARRFQEECRELRQQPPSMYNTY